MHTHLDLSEVEFFFAQESKEKTSSFVRPKHIFPLYRFLWVSEVPLSMIRELQESLKGRL